MIHRQYISTQRDTRTVDHTDGPSQMINNHGDQQSTTEDLAVNSIPVRKKKGHKKAKARVTEIPDMDTLTSGEFSSRDITPCELTSPEASWLKLLFVCPNLCLAWQTFWRSLSLVLFLCVCKCVFVTV